MTNPIVRVRVPASTANLGPGFDALGMALDLYCWIEMTVADQYSVELIGPNVQGLPTNERNLIIQVANAVFDRCKTQRKPLKVSVYSEIPLTRGLGSSAAAIVGGMAAANLLLGEPLRYQEIFQMATEWEQHPDNVGAALFGGFVVATWDGQNVNHVRIEPHHDLDVLVAIPNFELSTEKARSALPEMYSRQDAVFNLSHASLLVAALSQNRLDLLADAMRDRIHQPYRAALVPGLEDVIQSAHENGALGAALSGAGPTLLCFVNRNQNDAAIRIEQFIKDTMQEHGVDASFMWLRPSAIGIESDVFVAPHYLPPNTLAEFVAERLKESNADVQATKGLEA